MENLAQGNTEFGDYNGGQYITFGYGWYYCGRSNGQNGVRNDALKQWIEALPEKERAVLEKNLEAEAQDSAR
jgi:hypothetical protein